MTTPLKKALRLARRQKSLITSAQLAGCDVTVDEIRGLVAKGHLERVVHGLYRAGGAGRSFPQDAMAAVLVSAPGAYLAGLGAANLYGAFGVGHQKVIDVAVVGTKSARNPLARVHRFADLPRRDTATVAGIPVLHPVRLSIELAATLPYAALCDVVDDFVIRKMVTIERLVRRIEELGPRRGSVNIRRAAASWGEGETSDSVWNRRLARLLVSRGAPEPVLEHDELTDDGVFLGRADLSWPDRGIVFEVQSMRHHAGPRKVAADIARRRRFRAAGRLVLEATPAEIRALDESLFLDLQAALAA